MTSHRLGGTAAAALLAAGVAACAAPVPSSLFPAAPTATASTRLSRGAEPSTPPPSSPAPRPPDSGSLAAELEVMSLGIEATEGLLEFASTGSAIVYSSGIAGDAAAGAAPDLWRLTPGPEARPELIWRNPARDRSIVRVGGDLDTVAFVDMPIDGTRAWNLWVLPRDGEAVLLDTHPGDEAVPSLVPSFSVYEPSIAWTSFDRGSAGPVSQMLAASAPDWRPRLVTERPAAEAELWLPSLYGDTLVYAEVRYAADRASDERRVYLASINDSRAEPRRLDSSGLATMPQIADDVVVWKEADPGFNMFNWGRMYVCDLETGRVTPLAIRPQEYVNYPSAGSRFVAWWGSDAFSFGVYDLVLGRPRLIVRYPTESEGNVLRPHVRGDLLAWIFTDELRPGGAAELRWAWLPGVRDLDP